MGVRQTEHVCDFQMRLPCVEGGGGPPEAAEGALPVARDCADRERETGRRVLAAAVGWIGTPYRHQASQKGVGCDCLGLVRGIWREVYGSEPEAPGPYAPDWAEAGGGDPLIDAAGRHCRERAVAEAAPGDLLLFRWRAHLPAKHAGILFDARRFVHAYQGHAVTISALVPQWRRRIAAVFSFPG